jgi:Na+-transporting methylmalonyl-CoA/oxaloacetate decarboxylase gamma subunit
MGIALVLLVVFLVIIGALVASFFVKRYKESDRPGPDWQPTDEIFNDPSTNRVMRVWLDGGGNRHYVPEGQLPSP